MHYLVDTKLNFVLDTKQIYKTAIQGVSAHWDHSTL